jgi:hypothetical protein
MSNLLKEWRVSEDVVRLILLRVSPGREVFVGEMIRERCRRNDIRDGSFRIFRLFGSFDLLFIQDRCRLQTSDFARLGTIPYITASNEYVCYKWARPVGKNWQKTFDIAKLRAPLVAFSFLKINPLHTQQSGVSPELEFANYLVGTGSVGTVQMLNTFGWSEAILAVTASDLAGLFQQVADRLSQIRYTSKKRTEHFAEKTLTIIGHSLDSCASGSKAKAVPLSRGKLDSEFLRVDCSLACKPNAMAKVKKAAKELLGPQANLGLRFGPTDLHFQVSLKGIATINELRQKLDAFKLAMGGHLVRTHTSLEYVTWQSWPSKERTKRWPIFVEITQTEARALARLGPDGGLIATAIYRFGNLTQSDLSADAYSDLLKSVMTLKDEALARHSNFDTNWPRRMAGYLTHLESAINQRGQNVYLGLEDSPFATYPAGTGMQRVFKSLEAYAMLVLRRLGQDWNGYVHLGSLASRYEHFGDILVIPPDAILQSTSHWAITHELMHILENIEEKVLSLSLIKEYSPAEGFIERQTELTEFDSSNLLEIMADVLDYALCCPLSLDDYLCVVWQHLTDRIIERYGVEDYQTYFWRSFAVICYEHFGRFGHYDEMFMLKKTRRLLAKYVALIGKKATIEKLKWGTTRNIEKLVTVQDRFIELMRYLPWIFEQVKIYSHKGEKPRLAKQRKSEILTKLERGELLTHADLKNPESVAWHLRAKYSNKNEPSNRVALTWLLSLWHLYQTETLGPDLSKWVPLKTNPRQGSGEGPQPERD